MKLIIEETEQKMSESAMFILLGAMMQDKRVNISLTSGRSDVYKRQGIYCDDLIEDYRKLVDRVHDCGSKIVMRCV